MDKLIVDPNGNPTGAEDTVWDRRFAKYGLPTLLLGGLLYFFIWPVWDKGIQAMPQVVESMRVHEMNREMMARQQYEQGVRLEQYLRIMCEIAADGKPVHLQKCLTVR